MSHVLPTILLVDDDAPTRYLMQRALRRLQVRAQVLEAEDGAQALAAVQAHCRASDQPSSLLVLLDLNMPVMDGLEFLEHQVHLPQICRQVTAVIVVTGTPDPKEQARARALAVDLVPKPLGPDGVAELLRRYLPVALSA
ncbi:response regulator [Solirubrum puertoriconensis]|uniref:Response regulatory domain-containing protein n=1 Tax=Solirubrum puertoriconensis TaxID=1751427 RepID=A0A9X0HJ76_SOLP1|nr:response regulator [Solirubrum puertoriconensis]KUG06900.1 hypothetical protein ASU33_06130 [Solirubrum puertoriconensis]